MVLKTIIVDDEPLARTRIRQLLVADNDIQIVGEARNGKEANKLIASDHPDLLFLDIQMPDYDGFSVLSQIKTARCPVTIFVTAYDQFAIQAFEINALDYLLKPFDDERFFKALDVAKDQVRLKQFSKLSRDLKDLVASYEWEQQQHPLTIPIKQNGIIENIRINDIFWIEAEGNYVKIQLKDRWYLYRSTLTHLTNKLQQFEFLRIHRGLLVNTQYLNKVVYQQNNEYLFSFCNGTQHTSSRSYKNSIARYLQDCSNGS